MKSINEPQYYFAPKRNTMHFLSFPFIYFACMYVSVHTTAYIWKSEKNLGSRFSPTRWVSGVETQSDTDTGTPVPTSQLTGPNPVCFLWPVAPVTGISDGFNSHHWFLPVCLLASGVTGLEPGGKGLYRWAPAPALHPYPGRKAVSSCLWPSIWNQEQPGFLVGTACSQKQHGDLILIVKAWPQPRLLLSKLL